MNQSNPGTAVLHRSLPAGVVWRVAAIVVASFLVGAATSWAQGFLPYALSSFANSSSGWTIVTVALVYAAHIDLPWSSVAGAASFVALVLGYTAASDLRGLYYNPVFFGVIGVIVGPFVGAAAGWLHRMSWRAHAAAALLAGICVGEATSGLTLIGETTSWVYWTVVGVLGMALMVTVVRRRPAPARVVCAGVVALMLVAAAFVLAYALLGSVAF
ncbi:MAG: DUF6518 family protein [Dermatophilaceae bacterium]